MQGNYIFFNSWVSLKYIIFCSASLLQFVSRWNYLANILYFEISFFRDTLLIRKQSKLVNNYTRIIFYHFSLFQWYCVDFFFIIRSFINFMMTMIWMINGTACASLIYHISLIHFKRSSYIKPFFYILSSRALNRFFSISIWCCHTEIINYNYTHFMFSLYQEIPESFFYFMLNSTFMRGHACS